MLSVLLRPRCLLGASSLVRSSCQQLNRTWALRGHRTLPVHHGRAARVAGEEGRTAGQQESSRSTCSCLGRIFGYLQELRNSVRRLARYRGKHLSLPLHTVALRLLSSLRGTSSVSRSHPCSTASDLTEQPIVSTHSCAQAGGDWKMLE